MKYKYKFKVGDKVTNKGKGSGVIIDGVVIPTSTGEVVNKFQPSGPGPYYYVKSGPISDLYPDGWIIGVPEDGLELNSET